MKDTRCEHLKLAANCWEATDRINRATWALENAMTELLKVLPAGHAHPAFHNIQIELRNLDYVLRTLPIDRDEDGRPLHPTDIKRGVRK